MAHLDSRPFRVSTPLQGMAIDHGILQLSTPPLSLNNLFENAGKQRIASEQYRQWQAEVALQLNLQAHWHVPGQVVIQLVFHREKTRADLDNLAKPVIDALVKNGRISDDRNVCDLRLRFSFAGPTIHIDLRRYA